MLTSAKKALADLVNTTWPGYTADGRILHPDDRRDVAAILAADASRPVILLHSPTLAVAGPVNVYACMVDVCAATENDALRHADTMLAPLRNVSPIAPTRTLAPDATVLREDGFWRAAINFTLRVK